MSNHQDKGLRNLTIIPELRDLIPPLSAEEFAMLEESIVANGCETPITVWNDTIVDGHNRYTICRKHSIPFAVTEKNFADMQAVMLWMITTQLGRRNLNSYQKAELALNYESVIAQESRQGQRIDKANFVPISERGMKPSYKLAALAGVGHDTMGKVKKIRELADEETKTQLRHGETTINRAYTELMRRANEGRTRVCDRCHEEKPYDDFVIPTNRKGFSNLCKVCESEVRLAEKEAAAVAKSTVEPVVTRPVSEDTTAETVPDEQPKGTGAKLPLPEGMTITKAPAQEEQPHGNFSTLGELRDVPENFPKVVEIFRRTLDSCVNGIDYDQRQYKPSMACPENTAYLVNMIEAAFTETLANFKAYVANVYGDKA